ncbi:UDP-N-acetylglucosamine transferase subunit alg14 [Choanephora cucurbitarum]|uniref:UDP-N-acetylglucosamine transferase subunit ALG14 n=1 Tax=Choanephora cucurbitarum TaxID=101091 RepID=A0A1C7NGH7_9FUNG|nr:UDP-N-acetylglucosamine transferase subunit alg14 [Choanephora cucurbitarum]
MVNALLSKTKGSDAMLGGHTAEMLQLVNSLNPTQYTPRTYVVAHSDLLSEEKARQFEQHVQKGEFKLVKMARARHVGQSWLTVPFSVIKGLFSSVQILISSWPDVIICNGPGSCIPICILSYLPRIFLVKKMEIIYIESFARVYNLSLTGKLLYPFVDRFLVQWPELSNRLQRAEYRGILV